MNFLQIFTTKEKQKIIRKLKEQFGISHVPGFIVQRGAERLFLFQGSFTPRQITELEQNRTAVERVGMYFAKEIRDEIRLSIDGINLLKDQITKNIFELNDEQYKQWMQGEELLIETGKKTFLVMKYKDDFVGMGKASAEKISNYVPKNRRLKIKN
jgi:NOL1/NOP2/fmu family ribosome biogenesis protein